MKEGQEIIQEFENTKVSVIFSEQHDFLIDSNALALCYQVTESNLRHHKNNNPSDFIEGKHFVSVSNTHGGSPKTYWTQRGVVQLGFFIKSETATRFRRWAEDLIIKSQKQPVQVLPTTYKEALIALVAQVEENEKQTKAIEEMKPKAEFYDAVTESTDTIDIGQLAKVLNMGIGRTKLFSILREKRVLMKNNTPFQEYIDRGYFRVVESKFNKPDGSVHINLKTVVFKKGVDGIRKILNKK